MSRLCEYQNNGVRCKNWISSSDEEVKLCPVHAGVIPSRKEEMSDFDKSIKFTFDSHTELCDKMDDKTLRDHMVQLQGILESIKIKQQAAQGVYAKRVRAAQENGDKEKIQALRTAKESVLKPKISEKEKEIQKMMKLGLSREKALTLLGFTDIQ